jgi:hypothetical protein
VNQQWLNQVEHELSLRDLPRRKIRRLVAEMCDHLEDARSAARDANRPANDEILCQRIGQPSELAQAAWENHLATSYAARHPLLAFCILPIPLTLLGWALAMAGMIGIIDLASRLPWLGVHVDGQPIHTWPAAVLYLVPVLELLFRVVPPAVSVVLCSVWAGQMGRDRKWRFLACLLIAAAAGLLTSELLLPVAPGQGRWTIGFMAPGGYIQLMQLAAPLLLGFLLDRMCGARELQGPAPLADGLRQAKAA